MTGNLAALRAFDAAARHGTYTSAATELRLTQSCISRHIRTLEDSFGCALFHRSGRRVMLTPKGSQFHAEIAPGFEIIRAAVRRIGSERHDPNRVAISLAPSVATLWLAPLLSDFAARNPRIELVVQSSRSFADLDLGQADLAIRYGEGKWPDVEVEPLGGEDLFPVCSAAVRGSLEMGEDPRELLKMPLLREDLVDGWEDWFGQLGIAWAPPRGSKQFDDSASLYYAAAAGLGVALGRSLLVRQWLADGKLARVGQHAIRSSYSYWLVWPKRRSPSLACRLLAAWIRDQFARP